MADAGDSKQKEWSSITTVTHHNTNSDTGTDRDHNEMMTDHSRVSYEDETDSEDDGLLSEVYTDYVQQLLGANLHVTQESETGDESRPEQVLDQLTLAGIAEFIKTEKCHNVIVMTGAGISTSAGIPDFRSPGSGLYHNLQKFDLPDPQAVFDIGFFQENPQPFFELAKGLYPEKFKPTPCHYFIRLLQDRGILLRNYTQNVDTLERVAGVADEKLVEAHGTFHTSHCLNCSRQYDLKWTKERIFKDAVPLCTECNGVVKPDVVFFGESLPAKFFNRMLEDFPKCDLLIVMGTSLKVQPFASLIDRVPSSTPRLLINREKTGEAHPFMRTFGFGRGLEFDSKYNYRDVAWIGSCDDGCMALAEQLGWKDDLDVLITTEWAKLDVLNLEESESASSTDKPGTVVKSSPVVKSRH